MIARLTEDYLLVDSVQEMDGVELQKNIGLMENGIINIKKKKK